MAPDNLKPKKTFGMRIRIQELTECVSSTKTLDDGIQKSIEKILFYTEGFKNKIIAKTCAKTKIFAKTKLFIKFFAKTKTFCENQCCGAGAARSRIFWSEPEP
jgi:hypothetical protein